MRTNPFVGTWTYRSFQNKSKKVEDWNEIRLWQADLELREDGPDLLTGKISDGTNVLDVRGEIFSDGEMSGIKLRGTGIPKTNTEGWIYDYVGFYAPAWSGGDAQQPAIVGTVIRTNP